MAGAFAGVRILDFTQGIAGPMACMIMADHGAEVVKVEQPAGDAFQDHPGYITWNRNKTVVRLDLRTYEGLHAARELLATAAAAVFDHRPGELERLGLDSATLCAANPGLLHAWLPPYGREGRWSQLPANDALLSALTGVAFLQFSYEDMPVQLVTPQLAYAQAMVGAAAIGAGLYERTKSGKGQALMVSGLHGTCAVESGGAIRAGEVFRVGTNSSRGGIPNYRLYQCADGKWFFLGTLTPQFFLKALEVTGTLDIITMPGIDGDFTNLLLPANIPAVAARLDAVFAEKPRDEWMRLLGEAGVPKGPVGTREEWFAGETVAANGMRIEMEHPTLGAVTMPGVSVKLSNTPGEVRHLARPAKVEELAPPAALPAAGADAAIGEGPLAGVRVLDLGAFIAGTFAPTILGNFGADILKVEPFDGDAFRTYGLIFIGHNRGKRSLALDLKSPQGRELLYDLVRECDVVLDNYRLGVRERLGIDYATLAKINPRIISCSVTGYGPEGPLATDPGFDPLVQARSGMMAAQGGDDEPVFHQVPVNDTATAMMAAFGIIAALRAREVTGRGQNVETCLTNQSILCQSGELTQYEGRRPNPVGARDCPGVGALQRFYRCGDGEWLAIAASEPGHFQQLAAALGHPEWAGRMTAEQALAEPAGSRLAEDIAAALSGFTRDDALDRLCTRHVPAAPALRVEQIFSDPFLAANGFLDEYDHPQFGPIAGVRGYAEWSRTPGGFRGRAPLVGEHSIEILRELGIDEGRIESLVAAGVVRQG
ncbi:CoA transferase [bacterium]|nr:MAG: CoA transferase [bacterium]MCL4232481.1 CoA transferase [Dehalococcoidia bacterium]